MTDNADVVIIGAGGYGASVAYHFAARGVSTILIDRHAPASQTSARAAGLAVQIYADDHLSRISMRSVAKLRSFQRDTGEALRVHVTGSIKVARTDADAQQIAREIERGRALDVDIGPITAADAHRRAPWLEPWGAAAMWFAPGDLHFEPGDLPRAYVRAAQRRGADVRCGTTVLAIEPDGEASRVVTDHGTVHAPTVVLAAGAWAPEFIRALGLTLPVVPYRHMLFVTEPLPQVRMQDPCVRVIDAHSYVRPERGGLLFGAYEPEPVALRCGAGVPQDMNEIALDETVLRQVANGMRELLPDLTGAPLALLRGGLPTMTPDGGWIVDRLPVAGDVFVVTGDNVAGLGPSPAVGEDLAAWISSGRRPAELEPFGLSRLAGRTDAEIRDGCRQSYVSRYRDGLGDAGGG